MRSSPRSGVDEGRILYARCALGFVTSSRVLVQHLESDSCRNTLVLRENTIRDLGSWIV